MRPTEESPVACEQIADRPRRLLAGYLLNDRRGRAAVAKMIEDDINRFKEMGACGYASDLHLALNHFELGFHSLESGARTPVPIRLRFELLRIARDAGLQ